MGFRAWGCGFTTEAPRTQAQATQKKKAAQAKARYETTELSVYPLDVEVQRMQTQLQHLPRPSNVVLFGNPNRNPTQKTITHPKKELHWRVQVDCLRPEPYTPPN